jgi:hypothetical protein
MTFYVDAPSAGPVQGIWGYPPRPEDQPNYICDRVKEGLVITDLASARRFFREKCRWNAAEVRGITAVTFLTGQTWQRHRGDGGVAEASGSAGGGAKRGEGGSHE